MKGTLEISTGREMEAQKGVRRQEQPHPQVFPASQRPRCHPISWNGKLSPGNGRLLAGAGRAGEHEPMLPPGGDVEDARTRGCGAAKTRAGGVCLGPLGPRRVPGLRGGRGAPPGTGSGGHFPPTQRHQPQSPPPLMGRILGS